MTVVQLIRQLENVSDKSLPVLVRLPVGQDANWDILLSEKDVQVEGKGIEALVVLNMARDIPSQT